MNYEKTLSNVRFKRPKKPKKRFGANQKVDSGTYKRAQKRLNVLDVPPKGVNVDDGITGREARKIKYARARQKQGNMRYTV
jgi:hypothetical protein